MKKFLIVILISANFYNQAAVNVSIGKSTIVNKGSGFAAAVAHGTDFAKFQLEQKIKLQEAAVNENPSVGNVMALVDLYFEKINLCGYSKDVISSINTYLSVLVDLVEAMPSAAVRKHHMEITIPKFYSKLEAIEKQEKERIETEEKKRAEVAANLRQKSLSKLQAAQAVQAAAARPVQQQQRAAAKTDEDPA